MKRKLLQTVTLLFFVVMLAWIVIYKSGWLNKPPVKATVSTPAGTLPKLLRTDTVSFSEHMHMIGSSKSTIGIIPLDPTIFKFSIDEYLQQDSVAQNDTMALSEPAKISPKQEEIMLYGSKSAMVFDTSSLKTADTLIKHLLVDTTPNKKSKP